MTFYHDTRRREAHTGDRVRAWAMGRIVVPLADEGRGSARSPPGAPRQTVARQGCDAPRPAPAIDDRWPSRPRGEWRSLMAFATRREEDDLWSAPPPSSASSTTLASGPSRHRRRKGALQAEPHGRWIGPSRQCGPVLRARDARRATRPGVCRRCADCRAAWSCVADALAPGERTWPGRVFGDSALDCATEICAFVAASAPRMPLLNTDEERRRQQAASPAWAARRDLRRAERTPGTNPPAPGPGPRARGTPLDEGR